MMGIYKDILQKPQSNNKLLAVLIDPDKTSVDNIKNLFKKINTSIATHIFVGGSEVEEHLTEKLVIEIKTYTNLPVILFPGDVSQITDKASGILFLSLISGRNPDYLIGKHVEAVSKLLKANIEIIPTGYILIENGKQTSVELVSKTEPMLRNDIETIKKTAKAGELLGMKLIYLEAGSGAKSAVDSKIISEVKAILNIPLIVGGGIRSKQQIEITYNSGADIVVIGTAFEENENFFEELKK
jgi:putative glycerol-1-phosphate prenyltransferase